MLPWQQLSRSTLIQASKHFFYIPNMEALHQNGMFWKDHWILLKKVPESNFWCIYHTVALWHTLVAIAGTKKNSGSHLSPQLPTHRRDTWSANKLSNSWSSNRSNDHLSLGKPIWLKKCKSLRLLRWKDANIPFIVLKSIGTSKVLTITKWHWY